MSYHGANIVQDPDIRIWDPSTGWTIRRPWRGTPNALANQELALRSMGIRFEYEPAGPDGGYDTLFGIFGAEETQPPDEEMTSQWDLLGNMLEKDIWAHPKVRALFDPLLNPSSHPDGVPTDTYIQFKKDIDDIVSGAKTVTELAWWPEAFQTTKIFVRALLRGVTSYPVSQFVLRHTSVVATNYSLRPAYTNVGKILTTAQIRSIHNPPNTLKFVLPDGYWLEQTPTCEQTASDKFTIIREWWHHNEYEEFIYDPITP